MSAGASDACEHGLSQGTGVASRAVWWSREPTVTITDAQPSADDELRHRRRVYTVIMAIHIIGFAVGGALYARAWWTGLIIIIVTGPLPWIAVLLANAAPHRPHTRAPRPNPLSRGLCQGASRSATEKKTTREH
jgi:hypothetical protein